MSPADARALIAHPSIAAGGALTWADLGCGDGTFTRALASQLPTGSVIHAIDTDARAIARIPSAPPGVDIVTHTGDFTRFPWPFGSVDAVLMANSLHYVSDQAAFLLRAVAQLRRRRMLLIEYDTDRGNPWVPYPVSDASARRLAASIGLQQITALGRRRSAYRRAEIYALLCDAIS
jgi:trans-aconitate methyltransferase